MFGGQTYSAIPVDISTADLAVRLQSSPQFGFLNIVRSRDCTGYSYTIEWVANGGAKTAISITNAGSVTPVGTTVNAVRVQPGGAVFKPLSGDMTRTYQTNPQVRHSIHETCIYEYCFPLGRSICRWFPFTMHNSRCLQLPMATSPNSIGHFNLSVRFNIDHHWYRLQHHTERQRRDHRRFRFMHSHNCFSKLIDMHDLCCTSG